MTNQVRERRRDTEIGDGDRLSTESVETYATTASINGPAPVSHDRVRWGAILAGLFAALTTLIVMSVLGLAIGLSSYDAGDPLSNFGLGAGIWGIVTALLAFLIGGWVAASTAGARGRGNGILNGSMVWVVAIPLILYLLGSGIGSLVNTAGSVAATGVSAVAPAAAAAAPAAGTAAAQTPGAEATVQTAGQGAVDAVQATASALGNQVNPQNAERVTDAAGKTAWGTLAGLLVGLIAALVGGSIGARPVRYETVQVTS
ncbi:MAG: hypothetical protein NT075_37335 [Chloroflexi bacterium]|nr:hypothetical protein [Chloroflexota bacterium]